MSREPLQPAEIGERIELETGGPVDARTLVKDAVEIYLDQRMEDARTGIGRASTRSIKQYGSLARNWIVPNLGNLQVRHLTSGRLDRYFRIEVTPTRYSDVRKTLHAFVEWLVVQGALTRDPLAPLPSYQRRNIGRRSKDREITAAHISAVLTAIERMDRVTTLRADTIDCLPRSRVVHRRHRLSTRRGPARSARPRCTKESRQASAAASRSPSTQALSEERRHQVSSVDRPAGRIVDGYAPVVAGLENDIDEVEDSFFGAARVDSSLSERTYWLLAQVIELQRAIGPLPGILEGLLRGADRYGTGDEVQNRLRNVLDHTIRATERVDSCRALLGNALTVHSTLVSLEQNEAMRRMSSAILAQGGGQADLFLGSDPVNPDACRLDLRDELRPHA
ncbi:CorA family divalent cation transporter [Nocardioides jensenii]|uniref:CorA family divalent cation transporter n=1 Tax=Nocardioides jensenii TaxID=1843 RepID=UPI00082C4CC8|nr:CorA family divalent cation transporter [Nocardioides jensenii]